MKTLDRITTLFLTAATTLAPLAPLRADPCGMVPPLWLGDGQPITRIGVQKTYAFYKDGIETLVLRPGFSGKVEEFGMLIPFPSPPAMRKVGEDVFTHLAAAVDPPEVLVDLRYDHWRMRACDVMAPTAVAESGLMVRARMEKTQVNVLRREAVGMYEVAVLEAGSPRALQRWMDDHGFRYPEGMDATCADYIRERWCFVAVRARVGDKSGSEPRPGMRSVDTALPKGAGFDGHVQAMGFRFRTDEFVVPMRLSAFNPGELRNVVYILTEGPQRMVGLPEEFVVRQVPGHVLYDNVTDPLPLRVIGGGLDEIPDWRRQNLAQERDARPRSGIARDLFASDLSAVRHDRLIHPHEDEEKRLLDIGERLGLRGPGLDALHSEAIRAQREKLIEASLADLRGMTLTVIDGDFPREVIARENINFAAYRMQSTLNGPHHWDAKHFGPAPLKTGALDTNGPANRGSGPGAALGLIALAGAGVLAFGLQSRGARRALVAGALLALLAPFAPASLARAGSDKANEDERLRLMVEQLAYPIEDYDTATLIAACGPDAIPRLFEEAIQSTSAVSCGWAVIALVEIGGDLGRTALIAVEQASPSELTKTWARAGRVRLAQSPRELTRLSELGAFDQNLLRPLTERWLEWLTPEATDLTIEHAIEAISRSGHLQPALAPTILGYGPRPLLRLLLEGRSNGSRNFAAGALASLSCGQDHDAADVAKRVLDALRLDPEAELPPWRGGALFIPSLNWKNKEARQLVRTLVSWLVWCDVRGRAQESQQLQNNLRSISLARAAGFELPSGQPSVSRWLTVFGNAFGMAALDELLREQGLEPGERYPDVFEALGE